MIPPHLDEEVLLRYRFDTAPEDETRRVSDHLRTCSECAGRFADLGKRLDLLNRYDTEAELDENLSDKVLVQVREKERTRAEDRSRKEAEEARAEAERAQRDAEALAREAASLARGESPGRTSTTAGGPGGPAGSGGSGGGRGPSGGSGEGGVGEEGRRVGFLAWLGITSGASLRTVRLAATLTLLAGTAFIAAGAVYYGTERPKLDTRVSGEDDLLPGSPAVFLVEVYDRTSKRPVDQADVRITLKGKDQSLPLFEGKTAASGFVDARLLVPDIADGNYDLEVAVSGAGDRDLVKQPVRFHRAYKVHLSTDKPLYQPGQTIHIRTLALERPRLVPPKGKEVTVEIYDPKGNRLNQKNLPVSRFGVSSFGFELADDVRLGSYRIKAQVGGATSEMEVKVARYSLPKFKVEVKPSKSFYLAGDTFKAAIEARYFFGKAVEKGDLRAVIFRPDGAVLGSEILAKTDAQGRYELTAELPSDLATPGTPQSVMMEVVVKDSAGQEERNQITITVTRDLLAIELVPEGGRLVSGMENTVYVFTTTPDGKATSSRVDVTLPGGKELTLKTFENGLGSFAFTLAPEAAPSFDLRAEDQEGRKGTRRISLSPIQSKILVAPDKAFYQPGETMRVAVQSISQFTSAIVEGVREGQTVLRGRGALKDGKGTVQLDLPAGLTGTVQLNIVALDNYDFQSPVITRKIVVAESQGLTVKLEASADSYRPGGEAKLKFRVTDPKGAPKAAAIGLSIVDESVFALASSRPALARAYFLLEKSLMETRYNLSAAEPLAGQGWREADQTAGRLLFSLDSSTLYPRRFQTETYLAKITGFVEGQDNFKRQAVQVAIAMGLVLLLVLVVIAAYRLPAWSGAILVGLGISGALMVPELELWWVLAGAAALVLAAMGIHYQRTKIVGWAYVLIPGVAIAIVCGLYRKTPTASEIFAPLSPTTPSQLAGEPPPSTPTGAIRPSPVTAGPQGHEEPADDKAVDGRRHRDEEGKLAPQEAPPARPTAKTEVARKVGTTGALGGMGYGALRGARVKGGGGGGADKDNLADTARAIPRREVRVRTYFPETMYIQPELVADERGVAEITIPLADTITSWRISALASSADGKIGALDQPLKVFQDFFVDVDLPPALVKGDEVSVPLAVYNYLSEPQVVRLEVNKEPWFELVGKTDLAVSLPSGGVDGREIRLRILQSGKRRLGLRADGTRLSDALAREILVSDAGQEKSDSVSGTLMPGEIVRVTVQVPDAATPGASKLFVKLFPSRISSALDGLENSLRQPYGCFEQTSSATYPNVLITDYLKRAGKLTPAFQDRTSRFISIGYQRLLGFEVAGGGFEWYGRAPAHQVLTAYALMEFKDMSRVYPIDEALIRRTQAWLFSKQLQDGSWRPDTQGYQDGLWTREGGQLVTTAYIGWALAEAGVRGAEMDRTLAWLAKNADRSDDPYTLALVTATLAKAKHASAAQAATKLQTKVTRQGNQAFFSPASATVYYGRGRAGAVETTALAAYALGTLGVAPTLVNGALEYLAASRDYRGTWYSTQATVLALRAILALTSTETDQSVTVTLNGQDAGTYPIKISAEAPELIDLGAKARMGANVVELKGQARATFQVVATYVLPWTEKDDEKDRPLLLKVDYGRTKVDLGDVVPVDVQLTYRKPEPSGMALVSLGLPAGFSPLPEDLDRLKNSGTVGKYEVQSDKINLYFDRLVTGSTLKFQIRLKSKSRLKTQGVGSLAYLYYHPDVRTTAAPSLITVN